MDRARKWLAASLVPAAAGAFLALGGRGSPEALASVPGGTPVFSDPTDFGNPFFPFRPGGYRVFQGKEGGAKVVFIDVFRSDTRDFPWNGGTVTCRVLQETEFEDGQLTEISVNYFAEADDGSVYYFGETVDEYEDGAVVGNGGSWLVGGPSGGDPAGTMTVADPALFLPGNPEEDDTWKPEDVPDGPQETATVEETDRRVKVGTGTYEGCIEIEEHDLLDDAFETKWYAPGVGLVKGKGKGEAFKLVATTFFVAGD